MSAAVDMAPYKELVEQALALAGGTHSYEDIVSGVEDARYQFWPANRSMIVTEILQYPRKKVAHCFLAAGDLQEINRMREGMEHWAIDIGCQSITIAGRAGWARFLGGDGYEQVALLLEKELA